MRILWMAALMTLGLVACSVILPQQASRQDASRMENGIPVQMAATSTPPRESSTKEAPTAARQERDRQAFIICGERGYDTGPQNLEVLANCLQDYGETGVVLVD
jgi:hypothetical protein